MTITNICQAISYQMGEWPSLFDTPAKFLDHLLFTIGNGYELDESTNSFMIGDYFIHEFPIFNRERMYQKRLPVFRDRAEESLRFIKARRERAEIEYTQEQFKKDVDDMVSEHVYPHITPEDLTIDSFYEQIKNDRNYPRRLRLFKKDEDCSYRYVRPYPLSMDYSYVFALNENSPKSLLTVAHNFCVAWSNYLKDELESGNYYKKNDGRGMSSTKEQTEIIKSKIDIAVEKLADIL